MRPASFPTTATGTASERSSRVHAPEMSSGACVSTSRTPERICAAAPRPSATYSAHRTVGRSPPRPSSARWRDRTLGSVVIAESETGSGKTEAALWRFKILFEAGKVDALAFLLPTRVAAVSLEGRVRRFFRQLFPDPELRPNVVLAVPGYIQSDGERGSRHADGAGLLSRFETLWPDTAVESAAHRRWAAEHPKRALAAAAAVDTIDQALLSGLPVRHAHLRGAALLRALIVVDEVHASDAYMTELLTGVLRRHVDAGGPRVAAVRHARLRGSRPAGDSADETPAAESETEARRSGGSEPVTLSCPVRCAAHSSRRRHLDG